MKTSRLALGFATLLLCLTIAATVSSRWPDEHSSASRASRSREHPNIVFIILDDVGIDQMTLFGNGGSNPPILPNIDALAAAGLTFSNTWAMPECSPSRSTFFTGRFPLRTGVDQRHLAADDRAGPAVTL